MVVFMLGLVMDVQILTILTSQYFLALSVLQFVCFGHASLIGSLSKVAALTTTSTKDAYYCKHKMLWGFPSPCSYCS